MSCYLFVFIVSVLDLWYRIHIHRPSDPQGRWRGIISHLEVHRSLQFYIPFWIWVRRGYEDREWRSNYVKWKQDPYLLIHSFCLCICSFHWSVYCISNQIGWQNWIPSITTNFSPEALYKFSHPMPSCEHTFWSIHGDKHHIMRMEYAIKTWKRRITWQNVSSAENRWTH